MMKSTRGTSERIAWSLPAPNIKLFGARSGKYLNYCTISQPSTFLEYLKMLNISTFLRISQPSFPFISSQYLKFSNISNQYLKLNNISNLAISQMLNISNLAISQMLYISIFQMLQYLKSSNISNA